MKKFYILTALSACFTYCQSQSFSWAKVEGKYAYDYGYGIGTDNAGNVYVAGKYEEEALFSGTVLPNQGNHDIYLASYAPNGNLNWIRTGGSYSGDYARILACNKTNRVYIAGEIEGSNNTIVFPGSPITITGHGSNDIFVASYDLSGNLLWAKSEGSTGNEKALGVTYDPFGNVVVCGYYTDTTVFGGVMTASTNYKDLFVAKYDLNGNLLWMQHAGGPGEEEAKSVVCDNSGNIYICGKYSDGATFGTTTFSTPVTPYGQFYNAYIAKYSPTGSLMWVKSVDGDYDDIAWSITKDNNNKLYITGEFSGAMFDAINLYTNGRADVFVACYDSNGNAQWAVNAGNPLVDRARGISCDGSNLYITGQFGGTATFGPHTLVAADSSDIFIAELDNTGNFLWASAVGGPADNYEPDSYESGIAVCADGSGPVYATGALLDGGVFGGTTLAGYTRSDMFITKLMGTVDSQEIVQPQFAHIYPNPGNGVINIPLDGSANSNSEIIVYNYLGEVVSGLYTTSTSAKVDLSTHGKGFYFIEIRTDKGRHREKILVQ
ncbi:MAG: hypothetical protein K0Q95_3022 [Bacteroidota bacterium]|jgi:hypothetical protein|nr:hypothetical protein [Bacteroidota bacterium]